MSTGATRATQTLEILRHAAGQDDTTIFSPVGAISGFSIAPVMYPR